LYAFYTLFLISLVPAFIGVIFLFFTRETKGEGAGSKEKPKPNLDIRKYDRNLRVFFIAQLFSPLGKFVKPVLLLRSMDLGYMLSTVILMYILFNLCHGAAFIRVRFALGFYRAGRNFSWLGYTLYGVVYIAFGLYSSSTGHLLWFFWPLYGVYYAMTEGVEKAFVTDIALPARGRLRSASITRSPV